VLNEMLGSIQDSTGGGWKVLITDHFTTRVLSSTLKMSDMLECNVSVVEDLTKAREPLPLAAVYFIQPTTTSVTQLLEDFIDVPLYPSVHIFFSSKAPSAVINKLKSCEVLLGVLKTLKECNVEFLTVDSRTVVTDNPHAPMLLMGDQADRAAQEGDQELDTIASRLTTLLSTLSEFPVVRFKKGRPVGSRDPPGANARSSLTKRLAQKVLERADAMQKAGQLPAKESCDLLILDRSYDSVAPVIHEWTYECMVHDLLELEGNTFRYSVESTQGKTDEKEVLLDEGDNLWSELRHTFIAEVYSSLADRFKEFQSKNKAAKLGGAGLKGEMSNSSIRQLIVALPQFREVLGKLSLHIQISSDLRSVTNEHILTDVGELEQDLVLGDKHSKDLITFLQENQANMDRLDKVRLFMCYCATHPEKLDTVKLTQWQKLAGLRKEDMTAVCSLALLGVSVFKQPDISEKSGFFNKKKEKPEATRRKKPEDGGYALFRFDPLLKDIVSDLGAHRLPEDEFPYLRAPSSGVASDSASTAQSARTGGRQGLPWAKRDGANGATRGPAARRLIVFVIGGVVRSEMRVAHELSKSMGRDIILASTSVETPRTFIDALYQMNSTGSDFGA